MIRFTADSRKSTAMIKTTRELPRADFQLRPCTLYPNTFNYRELHSGSFTPRSRADIVDGSIPKDAPVLEVNNLLNSTTIFHELFYAVLGNDVTYPTLGEEYALADMLTLGVQESLKNPETFTRVAAAWDYTKNSANGVEFLFWVRGS